MARGAPCAFLITVSPVSAPNDATFDILLAEDNLVNQKVAVCMLQGIGHKAVVVGDGRAASLWMLRMPASDCSRVPTGGTPCGRLLGLTDTRSRWPARITAEFWNTSTGTSTGSSRGSAC